MILVALPLIGCGKQQNTPPISTGVPKVKQEKKTPPNSKSVPKEKQEKVSTERISTEAIHKYAQTVGSSESRKAKRDVYREMRKEFPEIKAKSKGANEQENAANAFATLMRMWNPYGFRKLDLQQAMYRCICMLTVVRLVVLASQLGAL